MSKIILASHGELSKGLLNSIQMIVGNLAEDIKTYCLYPGESPNDMYQAIEKNIRNSEEAYFILCDIKGGSVHTTLSKLIIYPNVTVISGMNMNMVLDLLLSYQNMTVDQLEAFITSAKSGITILRNEITETADEDF